MFTIISFFQKLIKGGGVGIRAGGGGWEIFQKLISGGRRLFGTREYIFSTVSRQDVEPILRDFNLSNYRKLFESLERLGGIKIISFVFVYIM